jgi:hypothetical protein
MRTRVSRFNIYLLGLALVLGMVVLGCKSAEQKKRDKTVSQLVIYLDAPAGDPDTNRVSVVTLAGVPIGVSRTPILSGGSVEGADLVETEDGGFAVRILFNTHGKLVLDTVSHEHRGRRLVIYVEFGVKDQLTRRYIAAPQMSRWITDGVIIFTPDATREECETIVLGLKNAAKENKEPWVF